MCYLDIHLRSSENIVVPHLGTLGFSIGRGGEIRSIYSYFLHAIFGREVLDETTDAHIK